MKGEYGTNLKNRDSGEYFTGRWQELFVELIFETLSSKSKIIEVDINKEYKKNYDQSPAMVKEQEVEKKKEDGKCPNCEKDITFEELQAVFTLADKSDLQALLVTLNKYRKKFGLDTCARKAHFFAQSIQEAGTDLIPGLRGENFNYYKDNLAGDLGAFRTETGIKIASKYGRQEIRGNAISEENQIILANFAYGAQYTTGANFKNTGNDGWNFRGRGLLQITGRSNYEKVQENINKLASSSDMDLMKRYDSPKTAISIADGYMTMEDATLTCLVEWGTKKMYSAADQTGKLSDREVVDNVVDIINRKTSSREKRHENYKTIKNIFQVSSCSEIEQKEIDKKLKYDIDKAVEYVNTNAQSKSSGDCAKFVRKAINAGDIDNIWGNAHVYYDSDQLVQHGFTKIGNDIDSINLRKGDIAAFGAVSGHKYGHIAMYNGSQWVSDFKQKSFWVATAYSNERRYTIYRWVK